jgi:hypothetical protein
MVQEKQAHRYRGVLCNFCRQPIPLPEIVTRLEVLTSDDAASGARTANIDIVERSFHIRCRVCEKESSYRSSDAIEVEGTPLLRNYRARAEAGFLQSTAGLAKAANG